MGEVHPWAGQFRSPELIEHSERANNIGWGHHEWRPCSWEQVPDKVHQAQTKLNAVLASDASPKERWDAIVSHHVELLESHAFFDGNKRLTRLVTEAVAKNEFGKEITWSLDHTYHAINAAMAKTSEDHALKHGKDSQQWKTAP
ncbi:MAG: Fic family protein [Rhodobacteraceae bacterium]|nr:Fic family protein [Paracoccaceae bacterium]